MNAIEKQEAVLKTLQKNGRLTDQQVADRTGLDVNEVSEIIERCEDQNIIQGYHCLIKESAMGQKVRAIIEVSVQPEHDHGFDKIASKMCKFIEVTDVLLVSGNYDLILTIEGDTLHEVADFIATKLAPIEGIRHHSTHFMLKKYKEAGFMLDEGEEHERLQVTP